MLGNVSLAFGQLLENLLKSSESVRKSSENRQIIHEPMASFLYPFAPCFASPAQLSSALSLFFWISIWVLRQINKEKVAFIYQPSCKSAHNHDESWICVLKSSSPPNSSSGILSSGPKGPGNEVASPPPPPPPPPPQAFRWERVRGASDCLRTTRASREST